MASYPTNYNDTIYGYNNYGDRIDALSGNDLVYGYSYASTNSSSDDDTLYGGYGSDTVYGGAGEDYIDGGRYYATSSQPAIADYSYNYLYGDAGNDTILGGYSYDYIDGGSDNDNLWGLGGNDSINGNYGSDTIYGGAGNDYLNGYGNTVNYYASQFDTLYGGSNADTFVIGTASSVFYWDHNTGTSDGYAAIKDFNRSEGDKIQLNGDYSYSYWYSGGNTTIYYGSNYNERLAVVDNAYITSTDVTWV